MSRTVLSVFAVAAFVLSVARMIGGATGWDFILWGWVAAFALIALAAIVPKSVPLRERVEMGMFVAGGPLALWALVWVCLDHRPEVMVLSMTYLVVWGAWGLIVAHREMSKNDPGFFGRRWL